MNNWISVKDCLPGGLTAVLVVRKGEIGVCYLYGANRFTEPDITHWMPLPEPPPPPDPFDVWWNERPFDEVASHLGPIHNPKERKEWRFVGGISCPKTIARHIWDSALASVKS